EVTGAKVMPPFTDAVCLIDGEQRNVEAFRSSTEYLCLQSLGREVEQLQVTEQCLIPAILDLSPAERTVDERRPDASAPELGLLIIHQGDDRRDHQGTAVEQERRHLVAERFTPTGGEDDQRIT